MHKVGYTTGFLHDTTRQHCNGGGPRPVIWSAWYPAQPLAHPPPQRANTVFRLDDVHPDAPIGLGDEFPVVMMSHGTGGSPESLGWLAGTVAAQGHVVIAPHHHGNTGSEPYRPEGFVCWWERATDISILLSVLGQSGPFAGRLDLDRVSALGYSLGGYTALALAGARTSFANFVGWLDAKGAAFAGPREFPDLAADMVALHQSSGPFRLSWQRQGDSFADPRIGCVIAIAPPPPVRAFDIGSLGEIACPVTLVTGEADTEAPTPDCTAWLLQANPRFRWVSAGQHVGHYTFLGLPDAPMSVETAFLFKDHPAVQRATVHKRVADIVLGALR